MRRALLISTFAMVSWLQASLGRAEAIEYIGYVSRVNVGVTGVVHIYFAPSKPYSTGAALKCGTKDYLQVSPNQPGRGEVLSVAMSALLSGKRAKVGYDDVASADGRCEISWVGIYDLP